MIEQRTIEGMFEEARRVVRWSDALFGYVYDLAVNDDSFTRGAPVAGLMTETATLRRYYITTGKRALELKKRETDEAMQLQVVNAKGDIELPWFAAIITQRLKVPCCLAFVYPFISVCEATRTLRFLQLIFHDLPPARGPQDAKLG